jgi:hypothetical protein
VSLPATTSACLAIERTGRIWSRSYPVNPPGSASGLTGTAIIIDAGHRLRVSVTGSNATNVAFHLNGSEFCEFKTRYGNTPVRDFAHIHRHPAGIVSNNAYVNHITLTHATVAYNTANEGADGNHRVGAGMLTLYNSLIVQAGVGEMA